jgi:putative methyltransferase (TIGR04325 family)
MKHLIRSIPGAEYMARAINFGGIKTTRGIYSSFEAAESAISRGKIIGFDHDEVAGANQYLIGFVKPSDYPLLYWMYPLMPHIRSVFDLGGNVGISYYTYRKFLPYRDDLRWTVFDVPSVVELGRKQTDSTKAPHLSFTTEIADVKGCEILLTSGTLQYLKYGLEDLLKPLEKRPEHLFVNRIPVTDRATYYTIQSVGKFRFPYRIINKNELRNSLQSLGYELVDEWKCTENWTTVRFRPGYFVQHYTGYYYRYRPS